MAEIIKLDQARDMPDTLQSIEAEQQVLGALLLQNDRVAVVAQAGGAGLFHDPIHAKLYERIAHLERDGILADPVTMRDWARELPGLEDLGGPRYLVRLAGAAITPGLIQSYCSHLSEVATKRRIVMAIDEARAGLIQGEDPAHHIAARLEVSLAAVEGGSKASPMSMTVAATRAANMAWDAHNGEQTPCVKTGIGRLDAMIGGLYPGELILLGGRPSMGKSAVATNIALNAARAGRKVAFASLEMGPEAIALRCLSESMSSQQHGRAVSYRDLRAGAWQESHTEAFAQALMEVSELPIQFLPRDYADAGAMMAGAKRARALMGGLDLLVVDYVQLMRASQAKSRYEVITEVSTALKHLAGSLDVPVLALSQLSRQVEQRDDKRPMLSDLRESGQLEQDADAVLFCYRDEYYLEREQPIGDDFDKIEVWQRMMDRARNKLEIIVAKQRQGPIGTARVGCNVAFNRIWEDGA